LFARIAKNGEHSFLFQTETRNVKHKKGVDEDG